MLIRRHRQPTAPRWLVILPLAPNFLRMWHGIHGHDRVVEQFRSALSRGRLASTFLFVGPAGVGRRMFALKLAQALLCSERAAEALDPCGDCDACRQVAALTHPDLEMIGKPAARSFIPVEMFIGDKEHRMREGLCHNLALKPFMGGRKIAVIDDADYLNQEGANCLLKTLEEPPPRSVLILIATSASRQLPTIRSRCQMVRFAPLSVEVVAQLLVEQGVVDDREQAERLAAVSEGSLERASELADDALWSFRQQLFARLAEPNFSSVAMTKMVGDFVDHAGREASARRGRLRQVITFVADFYRAEMRAASGEATGEGDDLVAAERVDRCLEALEHVDRNANQATLIACWLDELGQVAAVAR